MEQLLNEVRQLRLRVAELEESRADCRLIEKALRESEERYKKMVNAVTAYTYTVEVSKGQAISTRHSKGCIPVTGYTPEDYRKDPYLWHSMIYQDDRMLVENAVSKILKGAVVPPVEHRIIRRDGALVWIRNTMVPYYDRKGRLIRYDGLIEDISHRKLSEGALKVSEEKFRAIAQTAVDAIITADVNGNIIFWNKSAQGIFGYKEEEVMGKPLSLLIPERYRGGHEKQIEMITSKLDFSYSDGIAEMHGLRKDGSEFPLELTVSMWKVGEETFYSGIIRDITRRKHMEHELENLATTDRLTQAYNRTKFHEIIKGEIERVKRYGHPLSMILFDIDHFKKVNDNFGHSAGDYILKTLTSIVKENLREIDFLVRWGGEEFIVITPETDLEKAEILAERIRKAIEDYTFEQAGKITISLGVTRFRRDENEDSFIKRADDTMYKAKEKGRNRVEVS